MQPLYSVDHETRQNAHRVEDNSPPAMEETPLLYRFPPNNLERNPFMMVTVSLMLSILLAGVVIGIYLLIVQSNSENILPPVETPLQLVSRTQWLTAVHSKPVALEGTSTCKAKQVIVVQTDSEPCSSIYSCALLLQSWQTSDNKTLPYNFMVSTNGQAYEALGWHRLSSMFPQYPDSLVLAFVGDFSEAPPSKLQIDAVKNFLAESVSQQHLEPSYVVFGKNTTYSPKHLFNSLKDLPQWSKELTDA